MGRIDRFDPRQGGGFRMELTYLDPVDGPGKTSAARDVAEVEIVALEPDSLVVWRIEFASDDPSFAGTMTMTWTLAEAERGTEVSVRADDVPPGISTSEHQAGINSSLANLAAFVDVSGDGARPT